MFDLYIFYEIFEFFLHRIEHMPFSTSQYKKKTNKNTIEKKQIQFEVTIFDLLIASISVYRMHELEIQ